MRVGMFVVLCHLTSRHAPPASDSAPRTVLFRRHAHLPSFANIISAFVPPALRRGYADSPPVSRLIYIYLHNSCDIITLVLRFSMLRMKDYTGSPLSYVAHETKDDGLFASRAFKISDLNDAGLVITCENTEVRIFDADLVTP